MDIFNDLFRQSKTSDFHSRFDQKNSTGAHKNHFCPVQRNVSAIFVEKILKLQNFIRTLSDNFSDFKQKIFWQGCQNCILRVQKKF